MRIPVHLEDGDLTGASVCLCVADSSNTINKMTQSTKHVGKKTKTKHQTTDSGVNLTLLSYRFNSAHTHTYVQGSFCCLNNTIVLTFLFLLSRLIQINAV